MDFGSESASSFTSTQDHRVLSSSNNCPLVLSSPPCNAGVSTEGDEMISKGPLFVDELCAERPSNGAIAAELDNMPLVSLENGARALEAQESGDHGTDLYSRESVKEWKTEMEAKEHLPRWMAVEKLSSAASMPERTKNKENVAAANYNVPDRTMPASRRHKFFMVRMPRAAYSDLRSKVRLAELQFEEASKTRDFIRAALQLKRARKFGLLDKLKVVRDKERACKDEFQKKRLEIDPFQTALNRLKFADTKYKEEEIFSEEDLNNKIARLQHRIQHESIPLKEEKQLIREIKQLESQRSQVCANDAEHAHLLENYGPKEDIQDQLALLYGELDVLRANQNQAQLECKPIEKDLEDLNVTIDERVDQLEAAKRTQAAALAACKELKKNLNEQNAEFYKYRDIFRKAKELASSKNVEDLAILCNEQVESTLRCWNTDSSFRERYIKNNIHSTLRRLETLDGRSLGVDEEPLLLMSDTDFATDTQQKDVESASKNGALRKEVIAPVSSLHGNQVKELKGEKIQQPQDKVLQGTSSNVMQKKGVTEAKKSGGNLTQSSTKVSSPSLLATTLSVSTAPAPVEDAAAKEARAAELKEKRRQEEMAKAKEAAERKRRQAERAQVKAQVRAQREAERREKERAKKTRRKVAVGIEDNNAETPALEEKGKESGMDNLPKTHGKGSPSERKGFLGKQLNTQRERVSSPLSKKHLWQPPPMWLWVLLVILLIGLAVTFVARF